MAGPDAADSMAGPDAPALGVDAPLARRRLPRIAFFGSGGFALRILERLHSMDEALLVAVVSTPDRPAGRNGALTPTPVAAFARAEGLPLLQPASLRTDEAAEALRACRPDAAVLADYGRIVPAALLAVPPRGFLNLHPSLLPRHRGATPVPATIEAGDAEAGVTLFRMDPGMDTGPIVAVARRPLAGTEDAPALESALAADGADLLGASLGPWLVGDLAERPQPAEGATVTRPFRRADGALDPGLPAAVLERRVRALRPWPGTFLGVPGRRLIVREATAIAGDAADGEPGDLVALGAGLALVTADGLLVLDVVQPSGGRAMTGAEARRGRPALVGTRTVLPVSESAAT
jgi:methionyl-tRNA formyltransferase